MHIITIANKMRMSYAMINKNTSLIKNFDRNWRRVLYRKFESYGV